MNHLDRWERKRYRDGTWLWDSESYPRCGLCGDLRDNHVQTKNGVGHCKVCTCREYVEKEP